MLLRPASLVDSPFADLKPLPGDGRPISQWSDRDAALVDVVAGVRLQAHDARGRGAAAGEAQADHGPSLAAVVVAGVSERSVAACAAPGVGPGPGTAPLGDVRQDLLAAAWFQEL